MLGKVNFWALVLLSGILYGISYPPIDLSICIFFSLAIFLHLIRQSKNIYWAAGRGYLVFFIAGLVAISWISLSGMQENADRFLIFAGMAVLFVYPLFFVPAAIVMHLLFKSFEGRRRDLLLPALICFPFVWTSFEFLSTLGQITFPWLLAGNSQTHQLSKIQFIEYTGVFGISFWISATGALIYYSVSGEEFSFRKFALSLFFATALYFKPDVVNPLFYDNIPRGRSLNVGVIQPNINPWKKWGARQEELIDKYVELIDRISREEQSLDIIVLPETAFPYYFREFFFRQSLEKIQAVCDSIKIPLLVGTPDLAYYGENEEIPSDARIKKQSGERFDAYNSAILMMPGVDPDSLNVYHKIKLVPGSERMPYQEHLPFIKNLIEWGVGLGSWQIGKDTLLFELDHKVKFNSAICYESVFPGFFADFIRRGTEFSVIITNDGWWGNLFGTYQHNRYAVLRAIENRRWVVRCANTGVSCFIDPYGNTYEETQVNTEVLLRKKISCIQQKTFYTERGDLFAEICTWISAAVFLTALTIRFSGRKFKRR